MWEMNPESISIVWWGSISKSKHLQSVSHTDSEVAKYQRKDFFFFFTMKWCNKHFWWDFSHYHRSVKSTISTTATMKHTCSRHFPSNSCWLQCNLEDIIQQKAATARSDRELIVSSVITYSSRSFTFCRTRTRVTVTKTDHVTVSSSIQLNKQWKFLTVVPSL